MTYAANKNYLNRFWLDKLLIKIGKSNLIGKYSWQFVAGTAFWFRVDSLNFLSSLDLSDNDFDGCIVCCNLLDTLFKCVGGFIDCSFFY